MINLPKPANINHNIQAGYNAAIRNLIYPDGLIDADGFAIPALPSKPKTQPTNAKPKTQPTNSKPKTQPVPGGCKIRIKINRDKDVIGYENIPTKQDDSQVLEMKKTDPVLNGKLLNELFAPITNATYENLEPVSPVQVLQPEPNAFWIDDNSQYPKETLNEEGRDEVYVHDSNVLEGHGVLHPMSDQTEIHHDNNDIDKENKYNSDYLQYHLPTED